MNRQVIARTKIIELIRILEAADKANDYDKLVIVLARLSLYHDDLMKHESDYIEHIEAELLR